MELKDGYKNTDFGKIPLDWEYLPLNGLIDLLTGFPFPSISYSKSGTRLLRGSNIKRGLTDWDDEITQCWENITPEINKYILNEGDVVISMDGSLVGRSFAQLTKSDLPALLLQRVARIRSQKINISYLKEIVCSKYFTEHCDKVKTVTAIPHISPADIRNYRIPIPPTQKEQQAIAEVLSDTDKLIQALEKKIAKKRLIKQGAMQQLLTPKKGWEEKRLKEKGITNLITCGIAATPTYVDSSIGFPFLSSTNVKNGKITWSNFKYIGKDLHRLLYKNNPPLKGDILYSRVGTIGEAAIINVDFEFSIYVSLTLIKVGNLIHNGFLMQLLNSSTYKRLANNTVLMGGGVGNLNVNVVREFPISFPEYNEQIQISKILFEMDKEIEVLEEKLLKYKQLKQGLMQNLLTGKIRLV